MFSHKGTIARMMLAWGTQRTEPRMSRSWQRIGAVGPQRKTRWRSTMVAEVDGVRQSAIFRQRACWAVMAI